MQELNHAAEQLADLEKLLVRPTPEAIQQAAKMLAAIGTLLRQCSCAERVEPGRRKELRAGAQALRVRCERIGKLLEGARRAHWIRMRLITSLTQSYTARAEAKNWMPATGTINIRM
jgi:hypothetical protein